MESVMINDNDEYNSLQANRGYTTSEVSNVVLLDPQACLQKAISSMEYFKTDLNNFREDLNTISVLQKYNADLSKVGFVGNYQKKSGKPTVLMQGTTIDQSIKKMTDLLLQIKTQIDITCVDVEQFVLSRPIKCLDESPAGTWKDCPPFVYMNPRRNKFRQNICCILQTKLHTFDKSDITVHASDTDEDLAKCMESNDEQILSSIVTLDSKDGKVIATRDPFHIYLPIVEHSKNLLPKLKYTTNGNKWFLGDVVNNMSLPMKQEICLLGSEIQIRQLQNVQCVAVAIPPCEIFSINETGATLELEHDRNIQLNVPPGAFTEEVTVRTKVKDLSHCDLEVACREHLKLENVRQASSLLSIDCDKPTESDIQIKIHESDIKVDNMSEYQETIRRCSKWLVNALSMEKLECHLEVLFSSDIIDLMSKKPNIGDKIRLLIYELIYSPDSIIERFMDILKTTGHMFCVDKILTEREKVVMEDYDCSSDFDPEFELRIVSKSDNEEWVVKPIATDGLTPNMYSVDLNAGKSSFNVVGFMVPDEMSDSDVCKAASLVCDISCFTRVSLVIRQHHQNPDDVIIHCIRSDKAKQCQNELATIGFTQGPSKIPEFGMVDGEQLEITFDSNICLQGFENKSFVMTFYSQLDVAKYVGRLCVMHPERQNNFDRYNGKVTYNVVSQKVSVQRCGSLDIHLPKPTDEQLGYFSYTLDYAGKALSKYLAWQLTADNANSTRWITYAHMLVKEPNIYKYCVNHVDNCTERANQRQRCEAFLLYWASNYVGTHENKLDRMIDIFGTDSQRKYEGHLFIKPYCLSGTFSNENLRKIAYRLGEDWEVMARKLGVGQSTINEIKGTQKNLVRQSLKMLDIWRLSDSAIMKGTDLVKYFYECSRSAKCSSKLLMSVGNN